MRTSTTWNIFRSITCTGKEQKQNTTLLRLHLGCQGMTWFTQLSSITASSSAGARYCSVSGAPAHWHLSWELWPQEEALLPYCPRSPCSRVHPHAVVTLPTNSGDKQHFPLWPSAQFPMPEAHAQAESVSGQSSAICKDNAGISRNSDKDGHGTQYFRAAFNCQIHQTNFFVSLQFLVYPTPPTSTLTELVHPVHWVNQGSYVKK